VRRFGGLLLGRDGVAVKRLVWHWVGNATFQFSWHMRLVDNLYYVNLRTSQVQRDSWMPEYPLATIQTAAFAALPSTTPSTPETPKVRAEKHAPKYSPPRFSVAGL
jgi:hypothetical protein